MDSYGQQEKDEVTENIADVSDNPDIVSRSRKQKYFHKSTKSDSG